MPERAGPRRSGREANQRGKRIRSYRRLGDHEAVALVKLENGYEFLRIRRQRCEDVDVPMELLLEMLAELEAGGSR